MTSPAVQDRLAAALYERAADHIKSFVSKADADPASDTDLGRALADLNQALRHNPNMRKAYVLRAVVHRRLGKSDESKADLERGLIILGPVHPDLLRSLFAAVVLQLWTSDRIARILAELDEI